MTKLKMSAALYTELREAILPVLPYAPTNTMRTRWDCLWMACDAGRFNVRKCYDAGLNDDHIDSALKLIFKSENV